MRFSAELRNGRLDGLFHCQDVAEAQLAVFEHALDFLGGIAGAEINVIEPDARGLIVDGVPCMQRGADRRAGVTRRRLYENVLE